MISLRCVKSYCCEDISLIENYDKAINDTTQFWECHHKLETILNASKKYLIENNLYWKRPVNELIFMTRSDHAKLHKKDKHINRLGKKHSEETKKKQSEKKKEYYKTHDAPRKGKHDSEETRKRKSIAALNRKPDSEETRKRKSLCKLGKHRVYREDGSFYMSY